LLAKGADRDKRDARGLSVLDLAIQQNNLEAIQLLQNS